MRTMSTWRELDMRNRTVIITGANRGIGHETAMQIAKRGARVILACRNVEAGEKVRKEIEDATKNENVVVKSIDLNSLDSVRSFAKDILETEQRLDVLICNAGNFFKEKVMTPDGFESNFSTNYLGHFLLVLLLMPLLKKTQPARIIMLSSLLYMTGKVDFNNLNSERSYGTMSAYNNTKLAILLFVRELSNRLRETYVTVNAVHPGVVLTEIQNNAPWYLTAPVKLFSYFLSDIPTAARSSVFLAVSADVADESGKLYYCCRPIPVLPSAKNATVAKTLWDTSCTFAKIANDIV